MIYYGTEAIERIFFKDKTDIHLIDISINANKNTFSVTCCCDEDWIWEFYYIKSTYERIKFIILEPSSGIIGSILNKRMLLLYIVNRL